MMTMLASQSWIAWEFTFWTVVITISGLLIGSFLNVVIWRLPRGENLSRPRSHCPVCGNMIRWYDNIPIVSWLLLRAKCRFCKTPISARYPLVELTCGVLFLLSAWVWLPDFGTVAVCCLAMALLLAISGIDWDHKIIPDKLSYPGMVFALVTAPFSALRGVEASWIDSAPVFVNAILDSGIGLLIGGGIIWLIRIVGSAILRKEAMGFGDVKLLAFIGALVGPMYVLYALVLACLGGAVIGGVLFFIGRARPLPLQLVVRRKDQSETYTRAYVKEDAIYLVDACPFERGERVEMDMVLAANKVLEDDDVSLTVGGRVAKQPEDHPRGRTRIEFGKLDEDAEDLIGRFSISYKYIPFGPFLSLGGAAMALYGEAVTRFLREDYPNWLRSL